MFAHRRGLSSPRSCGPARARGLLNPRAREWTGVCIRSGYALLGVPDTGPGNRGTPDQDVQLCRLLYARFDGRSGHYAHDARARASVPPPLTSDKGHSVNLMTALSFAHRRGLTPPGPSEARAHGIPASRAGSRGRTDRRPSRNRSRASEIRQKRALIPRTRDAGNMAYPTHEAQKVGHNGAYPTWLLRRRFTLCRRLFARTPFKPGHSSLFRQLPAVDGNGKRYPHIAHSARPIHYVGFHCVVVSLVGCFAVVASHSSECTCGGFRGAGPSFRPAEGRCYTMGEHMFIIEGSHERDDNNQPLYWHNRDGWVPRGQADVFNAHARLTLDLPLGGRWVPAEPKTVLHELAERAAHLRDTFHGDSSDAEHEAAVDLLDVIQDVLSYLEEDDVRGVHDGREIVRVVNQEEAMSETAHHVAFELLDRFEPGPVPSPGGSWETDAGYTAVLSVEEYQRFLDLIYQQGDVRRESHVTRVLVPDGEPSELVDISHARLGACFSVRFHHDSDGTDITISEHFNDELIYDNRIPHE